MSMEMPGKRRPHEIFTGLFLLVHPIPVAIHVVAVTFFVLLAAWPVLAWPEILLLIGAHTAMQVAIAIHNDYCDRATDTLGKKKKPIPLGLITPREALYGSICCMALMLLLLLPLSRLAGLISLLYLALALGYNLGLKATPLSGVVFALAIPLIPLYAFVGVEHFTSFLGWFTPVAALLGIAINLANSLPDLEEDRASNLHTLAVVLGRKASYLVCTLCVLLSVLLIGFVSLVQLVPTQNQIVLPLLFVICTGTVAAYFYFRDRQEKALSQRYFYSIVCASLLLAIGWIIGVLR
ncbi:MAG TPA: UbiA family prenyltransferase [Ktedonobacteraceae bacterium]|nr:UbiA family prenyltransferase [Ktedonobacteraceae bacterium]